MNDSLELGKYTLQEIWEIPSMMSRALKFKDEIYAAAENIVNEKKVRTIYLTGDGTSYHAGFVSRYIFNKYARVKTHAEVSPEFTYLVGAALHHDDFIIGISQSGESEMTLQAVQTAKEKGIPTLAIVNHPDSTLANIADNVLQIRSGEEKSVLATKTYINTLAILSRLGIEISYLRKKIDEDKYSYLIDELRAIPKAIEYALPNVRKQIRSIAPYFKFARLCFVLGSGPDYGAALEASLKLTEGARIFSDAYSTAEFPHGPITLADESSWIIAMVPAEEGQRRDIILKLIKKVKERSSTVTGVYATDVQDPDLDMGIHVPRVMEYYQPFLNIIPIQLLSVELAINKGINCDKPKYLSKVSSV